MRRKIQILFALAVMLVVIRPVHASGDPAGAQEHTLRFFYNNVCASCHEEDKFYELFNRCVTSEEKKQISYEIRTYNLFLDADEEVYAEMLEEAGKDRSEYALPVLVADGQWISGYEEMERQLHGILFGEENAESSSVLEEENIEGTGALEEENTESGNPLFPDEEMETAGSISTSEDGTQSSGNAAGEKAEISEDFGKTAEGQQRIILFSTYSCEECEEAKEFLTELGEETEFAVTEYSIVEEDNVQTFKKLLDQYGYKQEEAKVPAVFAGERALFGAKEIQEKLPLILNEEKAEADILNVQLALALGKTTSAGEKSDERITNTESSDEGTSGEEVHGNEAADESDHAAAADTHTGERPHFSALFGAGLLSGFNPCSISMLLMLFSILLTSHASVLKNGLVYLGGKYAVYLGLGLGICFAASEIDQKLLSRYSSAVNLVIILLFLAAAVLNFLDFLNVRKNEYGKVRMQLPQGLRKFNHRLIRHAQGTEGLFLTLLVLGLGMAVSVGEFFCTGQIYMASILYLLRSGGQALQNLGALLVYVTAMSIPAAVIVVLIHVTKGTGRVSEFMLNHMAAIKLLNAVLFVLYALYFIITR